MVDDLITNNTRSIKNLLKELRLAGVHLWVERGKLRSKAPKGAITPRLRRQIRAHKDGLISFLQQAKQSDLPSDIVPALRPSKIPLSFAQQRLWFLDQLGSSHAYNMPMALNLKGPLNVVALQQTLQEIVRRHESLRTTFAVDEGVAHQVIHADMTINLPVIELSALAPKAQKAEVQRLTMAEATRPFDLSGDPMLRATLLCLSSPTSPPPQGMSRGTRDQGRNRGGTEHILLLTMHHIASDGWSLGVLVREMAALYEAFNQNQPSPLPPLPIQYADFAIWQRSYLQGEVLEKQLSYWKERLTGAPELLQLPTDRPRPAEQSGEGAAVSLKLDARLTNGLRTLSQQQGTTLYMTLLAGFQVLMARYSGQTDIVVASPIANRNRQEIEPLIGFFINTLALRVDLSGDQSESSASDSEGTRQSPSFLVLLAQVKETLQSAYEHQDIPFERLVEELQLTRSLRHNPLVQVIFALQNTPMGAFELSGLKVSPAESSLQTTRFDLEISLWEVDDHLQGFCIYSTDLFDDATIERMTNHFVVLLNSMVAHPDKPVLQLPMLTDAEYHQMVHEFNDSKVDFGEAQTIQALFEQQVERTPDAYALVFNDSSKSTLAQQLTYAELNARANQLAHHLISLAVQPDTLVAVAMERSLEMVVSLLAVLKAGGAYVPIDPSYPSTRIAYMLRDSAAPILLTQRKLELEHHSGHVIAVDRAQLASQPTHNPQTRTTAHHLAYVIYTSGSTGEPKGVLIEHGGAFNVASAQAKLLPGLTTGSRLLQLASLGFDAATFEVLMALMHGATLVIAPANHQRVGLPLVELLAHQGITHAILVPSVLQTLPAAELPDLSVLITAGEACGGDLVNRWAGGRAFFNLYGPTESPIWTTYAALQPGEAVHIGQPIPNRKVYILSDSAVIVPVGVPGELYIGGEYLARGYLNRPALTAERFIEHPQFGRLYKTGDLCRWLPASRGNIEFLGRTDFQVKIRGFRIELGEIESALLREEGVREAVVLAREENSGNKRLVGYIVGDADSDTLRLKLAQHLPDYMLPSAFVRLVKMPLTPSGKLDRRALLAPDYSPRKCGADAQTAFVAPRNEIEASLAHAFAEVLRLPQACPDGGGISIHDNFFHLGGDSILSIQLVSQVAQEGYTVSVKELFQHPTIAQLATVLANVIRTGQEIHASQEVQIGDAPLLPIQRWFLAANQPQMEHFNQSFLFTIKESIEPVKLEAVIRSLLSHHDALRCKFGRDQSGWQQQYLAPVTHIPLKVVDLQAIAPNTSPAEIEATCAQAQASLNPLVGDLTRWVYFKADGAEATRLLIVIHHLAVDGVSWRILLEDLATLLDGGQLPPKTSSYRDWGKTLQSATQNGHFDAEIRQWLTGAVDAPLPLDNPDALNTMGNSHHLRLTLSQTQTNDLLRTLPDLHDVTLDAVLLTALTESLTNWAGQTKLRVQFESHGRQELFETINLNRTVGWFTSAYPLIIPRFDGSAVKRIRYTLARLRRVTDGGISFGALHHFHPDDAIREQFEALPTPLVAYNYLGQLDSLDNQRFGMAPESAGLPISPTFRRETLLDSNAVVQGGQLHINWTISPQLRRQSAESLLDSFTQKLESLIAEARHSHEYIPLPSDQKQPSVLSEPASTDSWFVTLQDKGSGSSRLPLFCFYPVTGTISQFKHLIPYLSQQQPVYALQARGIYDDLPPFKTLEALASDTIRAIKTIQPKGPYNLLGWSFGARLAVEIAQQLQAQDDEVALLAILDEYPDNVEVSKAILQEPAYQLTNFVYNLGLNREIEFQHLIDLCQATLGQHKAHPIESLCQQLERSGYTFPFDTPMVKRIYNVYLNNTMLIEAYQLKPYTGSVVVFAAEASDSATGIARWQDLVSDSVEQVTVPGTHQTLLNPEYVERLGRELQKRL